MVKKVPQFQNNVDTRKKLTAVVVISALLRDLQNPQILNVITITIMIIVIIIIIMIMIIVIMIITIIMMIVRVEDIEDGVCMLFVADSKTLVSLSEI